jgi:hypothetical protein
MAIAQAILQSMMTTPYANPTIDDCAFDGRAPNIGEAMHHLMSLLSLNPPAAAATYAKDGRDGETSTYQHLHARVVDALREHGVAGATYVSPTNKKRKQTRTKETNVMGRFACTNTQCRNKRWSSKMVGITIAQHRGVKGGAGGVFYSAEVYHQLCQSCDEVGRLYIDEQSYVERVTWRIRLWAGNRPETPILQEKKGPSHVSELCIGCQRMRCKVAMGMDDEE